MFAFRLVAFNLGYLPGGDKGIITTSKTTLLALEASKKMLILGGLISLVVYVGHPGGREELETVEAFASGLCVDGWICCKFQMLNRPLAPVLVFIFKRWISGWIPKCSIICTLTIYYKFLESLFTCIKIHLWIQAAIN